MLESEVDIELDEDASIGTLIDLMNTYDVGLFDHGEKETLTMVMEYNKGHVVHPRQLGDWICINVDADKKLSFAMTRGAALMGHVNIVPCLRLCSSKIMVLLHSV